MMESRAKMWATRPRMWIVFEHRYDLGTQRFSGPHSTNSEAEWLGYHRRHNRVLYVVRLKKMKV
jgi:hypothetical protein